MKDLVKELLVALLGSKKFVAFLVSLVVMLVTAISGKFGLGITDEQANDLSLKVVGLASSYLVGQGIADHGKEAARVQASSTETTKAAAPPA